jgi:beta-N-acetylhexosaminidase
MTALSKLAGQLLSFGFEGTTASEELRARIGASEVGGVMIFRPNITSPGQLAEVVGALRAAAPGDLPLLVSIDQEGGLVQRLRAPATEWPPMLAVGSAGDSARAALVGRALGEELAAVGVGWNFAPVLDVHTNPANPVIGNRAFGTSPEVVSRQALAFWRGLRDAGVVGCGKHYPGHGDTMTDSHHELPVVPHDIERLRKVELAPFASAARAGVEAFMTAHVMYPALDPDRPATLSRRIATEVLRGDLGFRGVLVSDDLNMKAVAARYSIEELAVQAIEAGCDHLLARVPEDKQRAGVRGDPSRGGGAQRVPHARRGGRRARRRPQGRLHRPPPRTRRDAPVAARHPGSQGPRRLVRDHHRRRNQVPRLGLTFQEAGLRGDQTRTPNARPSPVGRTVARKRPLRASISCTDCIARIIAARSPVGGSGRLPKRNALSSSTMPPGRRLSVAQSRYAG